MLPLYFIYSHLFLIRNYCVIGIPVNTLFKIAIQDTPGITRWYFSFQITWYSLAEGHPPEVLPPLTRWSRNHASATDLWWRYFNFILSKFRYEYVFMTLLLEHPASLLLLRGLFYTNGIIALPTVSTPIRELSKSSTLVWWSLIGCLCQNELDVTSI